MDKFCIFATPKNEEYVAIKIHRENNYRNIPSCRM